MLEVSVEDRRGRVQRLAGRVVRADTRSLRRKGVQGRQDLSPEEGVLLVYPPRPGIALFYSIHMFGVPFSLVAAWLDKGGVILEAIQTFPGGFYFPSSIWISPRYVLELHPDHLPALREGAQVRWRTAFGE